LRQFEALGGAYSDDNVVLSMTSSQMGLTPTDANKGQSNWLWFRRPHITGALESYSTMSKEQRSHPLRYKGTMSVGISRFRHYPDRSPFANSFPSTIDGNSDYRLYLNPNSKGGDGHGRFVWHSNGQAWRDVFQAREEAKNQRPNEKDKHEDFMQTMSSLKDSVNGSTMFRGLAGIPAQNIPNSAFWVIDDDGAVASQVFDVRLKSYEGDIKRRLGLPCFMAEGINDGRNKDGTMDGHSWYHRKIQGSEDVFDQWVDKYDEATRDYLKFSGMVCGGKSFASILMVNTDLRWKEGIDCRLTDSCFGLGAFLPKNPKFEQYAYYFESRAGARLVYQNRYDPANTEFDHVWYLDEIQNSMRLYHLPVVKITGRPCNSSIVSDNIERIWQGSTEEPIFRTRNPNRATGDGSTTIPSICGDDLDRVINRYVPRSPYIDMPGIRDISAQ